MTEEISVTVETVEKAKKDRKPKTPTKNFIVVGGGDFWTVEEYAEANKLNLATLKAQLYAAYAETPAKTIRVPLDHPALVIQTGAGRASKMPPRYLWVLADGTARYQHTAPEGYFMQVDLKARTFTNADGTFELPWEKGEFKGTRRSKKAKEENPQD